MAWGARIRNASTGSLQIDQDYYNLALVQKTVIVSGSAQAPGTAGVVVSAAQFSYVSDDLPVFAFACDYMVAPVSLTRSGNTWTFFFYVSGLSRSITMYIFGRPPVLGPGWGMRIKKGAQIMFDSRLKYLRRVSRVSPGTGAVAAGKAYALMLLTGGYRTHYQVERMASLWRVSDLRWFSAGSVSASQWSFGSMQYRSALYESSTNPGATYDTNRLGQSATLLDVTGY